VFRDGLLDQKHLIATWSSAVAFDSRSYCVLRTV